MAQANADMQNRTFIRKTGKAGNEPLFYKIKKDFKMNKVLILMTIPIVVYYIIFWYLPVYGIQIAFKDYNMAKGMFKSEWVGLYNFKEFFNGPFFWRTIFNTIMIQLYHIVFGFPCPIILALLLNEVRNRWFKRTVQTLTYLPYFISIVIVCGMTLTFLTQNGPINDIIESLGFKRVGFFINAAYFRPIYTATGIWQYAGWGSILYLAALTQIDQEQYEAARIDGAGRWKQFINITFPGIKPTIVIMLILNMGRFMSEGFEKAYLLYNPGIYSTADIISTYVYRTGLEQANYSLSTAVNLFNSIVNLSLLLFTNWCAKRLNENSLF